MYLTGATQLKLTVPSTAAFLIGSGTGWQAATRGSDQTSCIDNATDAFTFEYIYVLVVL